MNDSRHVVPALVALVLVVVLLVLALTAWIGYLGTPSSSSTYGVPTLTYGSFSEAKAGTSYYYNATIESAAGGMTWGDLQFSVESASGKVIAGARSVTATNGTNSCNVAIFDFSSGTWSVPHSHCTIGMVGSAAGVVSGSQIQLLSTLNFTSTGDTLQVIGHGAFVGTSSLTIP